MSLRKSLPITCNILFITIVAIILYFEYTEYSGQLINCQIINANRSTQCLRLYISCMNNILPSLKSESDNECFRPYDACINYNDHESNLCKLSEHTKLFYLLGLMFILSTSAIIQVICSHYCNKTKKSQLAEEYKLL